MMLPVCVAYAAAIAAPELLFGVAPGQTRDQVQRAIAVAGVELGRESKLRDQQALAENLVRTHLLETLNRFELAPLDKKGELDARPFQSLLRAKRENREYVFAFSEKTLSYVFVRVPVPVDPTRDQVSAGSPDRLRRLRETLRAIANEGFAIAPKEKDRWGNVFFWIGRGREGAKLAIWYVPERDELRILAH